MEHTIFVKFPIMIYDNLCLSCTTYAKYADKLVSGNINIVGYYTPEGNQIKQKIFPDGYEGLEMSWFVTNIHAFGGHKGLLQFIKYVLFSKKHHHHKKNIFDANACTADCRTVNGVFIRLCSILTNTKVLVHTMNDHYNK